MGGGGLVYANGLWSVHVWVYFKDILYYIEELHIQKSSCASLYLLSWIWSYRLLVVIEVM